MCVPGFSYRTLVLPYVKNRLAESEKKLFSGNVLVTFAKKFNFMTAMEIVKCGHCGWDGFSQLSPFGTDFFNHISETEPHKPMKQSSLISFPRQSCFVAEVVCRN